MLLLQASFSIPFGILSRVPKIIVESILRRLNLLAPNVTKPEHLPYDSTWSCCFLAVAIGILYSPLCAIVIPFVLSHLVVSYFTLCRSALFSFSRGWYAGKVTGGKGLMWPVASKWLLVFLGGAQLMLGAVHLAQDQIYSLGAILPLPIITIYWHRRFASDFEPLLQLLTQQRIVADDVTDGSAEQEEHCEEKMEVNLINPTAEITTAVRPMTHCSFGPDVYLQPELCAATWAELRQGHAPPKKPGARRIGMNSILMMTIPMFPQSWPR